MSADPAMYLSIGGPCDICISSLRNISIGDGDQFLPIPDAMMSPRLECRQVYIGPTSNNTQQPSVFYYITNLYIIVVYKMYTTGQPCSLREYFHLSPPRGPGNNIMRQACSRVGGILQYGPIVGWPKAYGGMSRWLNSTQWSWVLHSVIIQCMSKSCWPVLRPCCGTGILYREWVLCGWQTTRLWCTY